MKFIFTSLLFLLILAHSSFAAQGGTSGQVKVTADVTDVNYIKMTPVNDMRMPTVYSNLGEEEITEISSNDATLVTGGVSGQDAVFTVAGTSNSSYGVTFSNESFLYDDKGHQLHITYDFGDEGSVADGNYKFLDYNGSDTLGIRGYIEFDGKQPVGSYNNYNNPLTITVLFDAPQTDKYRKKLAG